MSLVNPKNRSGRYGKESPTHTVESQNPRPFDSAQGRLCLAKSGRDKDGAPYEVVELVKDE